MFFFGAWRILLTDLGIRPADVLRLADLPDDLLNREKAALTTDEYFRLWHGIESAANDPLLPIKIGQTISVEAFDPPVFAALCSPNLNTALQRISRYKRLIMPMALHVKCFGFRLPDYQHSIFCVELRVISVCILQYCPGYI